MRLINILIEFASEREKRWAKEAEPARRSQWMKGERQKRWEREADEKKTADANEKKKEHYRVRHVKDTILKLAKRNPNLIPKLIEILSGSSAMHFEKMTLKGFLLAERAPLNAEQQQFLKAWYSAGSPTDPKGVARVASRGAETRSETGGQKPPSEANLAHLEGLRKTILKALPRSERLGMIKTLKSMMGKAPEREQRRIIVPSGYRKR